MIVNPAYGDTYSFPWKRGPHDQINEYLDTVPTYEQLRLNIYKKIADFDFLKALMTVYHSEDENNFMMTKVAVLRIISQIARIKKEQLGGTAGI